MTSNNNEDQQENLQNKIEELEIESKPKYPIAVFFIFVTEFAERFSYAGMRTVLTLYLRNVLDFSEDLSTTCYHVFLLLCYGLPVVGGIISDNWLGKYKTIVYISIVYCIGNVTLSLGSVPPLHLPAIPLTLIGLFLIAFGTGGIKPCVVSLGAEQFKIPGQENQLRHFFAVFLFTVNIGSLLSMAITPIFRRDVSCFGNETCYPLAFGFPASLMFFGIIVFICGKRLYTLVPPQGNILVNVVKCISYAIYKKFQDRSTTTTMTNVTQVSAEQQYQVSEEPKKHWLDYAKHKYDKQLIDDTKGVLTLLVYYIPVPMFFALYEQLGSRWTFQATKMDGVIGPFTIKPDQMQVANSVLMLTLIPVSQTIIYPMFHKCGLLKRPLQRMGVGGIFTAVSFLCAGTVELYIRNASSSNIPITSGQMNLNLVNTLPCLVNVYTGSNSSILQEDYGKYYTISPESNHIISSLYPKESHNISIGVGFPRGNDNADICKSFNSNLMSNADFSFYEIEFEDSHKLLKSSIITSSHNGSLSLVTLPGYEDLAKSKEGQAKIRFVYNSEESCFAGTGTENNVNNNSLTNFVPMDVQLISAATKIATDKSHKLNPLKATLISTSDTFEVEPGRYQIKLTKGSTTLFSNDDDVIDLKNGGSYLLILKNDDNICVDQDGSGIKNSCILDIQVVILTPPNEIHMFWLFPQYILMACGEILFIISGSEFSFTEAPASMKSVMQACWHLTNAVGNALVIISAQFDVNEATGFFTFAALMIIDTVIFAMLSSRYKYVTSSNDKKKKESQKRDC